MYVFRANRLILEKQGAPPTFLSVNLQIMLKASYFLDGFSLDPLAAVVQGLARGICEWHTLVISGNLVARCRLLFMLPMISYRYIILGLSLLWWNPRPKQLREEQVYLFYPSISQFITEEVRVGSQTRQEPEARADAESMEDCCSPWLAQSPFL